MAKELREKWLELALAGEKVVTSSGSDPHLLDPLPIFARHLGYVLYKNNLDEINSFRSLMVEYLAKCRQVTPVNEVMKNWLEALLEISRAYSTDLEEKRQNQSAVKAIRDSGFGTAVMLALDDRGKTLAELEKELAPQSVTPPQINGAIYGFCVAGLVNVFGAKGKQVFVLAPYGKKILLLLKEENK